MWSPCLRGAPVLVIPRIQRVFESSLAASGSCVGRSGEAGIVRPYLKIDGVLTTPATAGWQP
jgi:hypothetical protein